MIYGTATKPQEALCGVADLLGILLTDVGVDLPSTEGAD
jgi:hypothetical protein